MNVPPASAPHGPHRYLRRALRHAPVTRLMSAARRHETPHPRGRIVWHEWGDGPSVVLLHGGFGSWLHWVRTIESLTPRFRVLAADLPGLGESDPLGDASPTPEAVAAPIAQGLVALLPAGEPLRLAAFSLGSVIGAHVAVAMATRVSRVVLLGPSGLGDLWRNLTDGLARRHPAMSDDERRAVIRTNLEQSMIARPEAIDELAVDLQLDLVQQDRGLKGLQISMSDALLRVLPELVPRVVLVWGERDPYPTPDVRGVVEALRARLPALDARIVRDAGHWVAYEAPDRINPMLLELFSSPEATR